MSDRQIVINDIVKDHAKKIQIEKDKLITKRINEVLMFSGETEDFDINEEAKRMFPRIRKIIDERGSEHIYWNDGSIEGLRLISFYKDEPKYEDGKLTISLSYR